MTPGTPKIVVTIVPNLHIAFDVEQQPTDAWLSYHGIIERAKFAEYYGVDLDDPSEAPAAQGALCEFRLQEQVPDQACQLDQQTYSQVNLPSDVEVGVRVNGETEPLWVKRQTRLRILDKPEIGRELFENVYGKIPSEVMAGPAATPAMQPPLEKTATFELKLDALPFAEVFNRSVRLQIRKEKVRRGQSWRESNSDAIDYADTLLGQGGILGLKEDWFSGGFDNAGAALELKDELFRARFAGTITSYHWALGLLVKIGSVREAADVVDMRYLLRFPGNAGEKMLGAASCVPRDLQPGESTSGCELVLKSLRDLKLPPPAPAIRLVGAPLAAGQTPADPIKDEALGARVYCLRSLSPFVPLNPQANQTGRCGGAFQFQKIRNEVQASPTNFDRVTQPQRIIIRTTSRIEDAVRKTLRDAETVNVTLCRTVSGVLRPYRGARIVPVSTDMSSILCEYVPDAASRSMVERLAKENELGPDLKCCRRWSEPALESVDYIGSYGFAWDLDDPASLEPPNKPPPRMLFLVTRAYAIDAGTRGKLAVVAEQAKKKENDDKTIPGEKSARDAGFKAFSVVLSLQTKHTQATITLNQEKPAPEAELKEDDPVGWLWTAQSPPGLLLPENFDLIDIDYVSFRKKDGTELFKEREAKLDSLFVGVEYADQVAFEFAQSAASIEQHVLVSHRLVPSRAPETIQTQLQDDLQNFSSLRVSEWNFNARTWSLLKPYEQFMPLNDVPCLAPDGLYEYEFHYRIGVQTSLDASKAADKDHPARFFQALYRDSALDTDGNAKTRLQLQHTFGELRGSAEYLVGRHLDFAVANLAEIRSTAEESEKERQQGQLSARLPPMISVVFNEGATNSVILIVNLRRLLTPTTPLPEDSAGRDQEDLLNRARWQMYFDAWRCIAELSEAKQVSLVADLREFDFREAAKHARREGTGSFSFGAALAPVAGFQGDVNAGALYEWTEGDGFSALQAVARRILDEAAARNSKISSEDISGTASDAIAQLRSFFDTASHHRVKGDSIELYIETPLRLGGIPSTTSINSTVTALQFGLRITRNSMRQPRRAADAWQLKNVRPRPAGAHKGGVEVFDLEPNVGPSIRDSFAHWLADRVARMASLNPHGGGAAAGLESTILGKVPPPLNSTGINSDGDWIIPRTRRDLEPVRFRSIAVAYAARPVSARGFFGQAADRCLAHYLHGLDSCINARLGRSVNEWRGHFEALKRVEEKVQKLIGRIGALYWPTPATDTTRNAKMPEEYRTWLASHKEAGGQVNSDRVRHEIVTRLSKSPALFGQMKAFLLINAGTLPSSPDALILAKFPGDVARVHVRKHIEDLRIDEDTFFLFDGIDAESAMSEVTLLDPLPDDMYDSSFEIEAPQLTTFEDVIAEASDSRAENARLSQKFRQKGRLRMAARLRTELLTEDASRARTIDLPSRFRAVDPVFLDSGFAEALDIPKAQLDELLTMPGVRREVGRISLKSLASARKEGEEWTLTAISAPTGSEVCGELPPRKFSDNLLHGALILLRGDEEARMSAGPNIEDVNQALNNDTVSLEFFYSPTPEDDTAQQMPERTDAVQKCIRAIQREEPLDELESSLIDDGVLDMFSETAAVDEKSVDTPDANAFKLSFAYRATTKAIYLTSELPQNNKTRLKVRLFRATRKTAEQKNGEIFYVLLVAAYVSVWEPFELRVGQFRNMNLKGKRTNFDASFASASAIVKSPGALSPAVVRRQALGGSVVPWPTLPRERMKLSNLIDKLITKNSQMTGEKFSDTELWMNGDRNLSITVYSDHATHYLEFDSTGNETVRPLESFRFPLLVWPGSDAEVGQPLRDAEMDFGHTSLRGIGRVSIDLQWSRGSNHQFLRIVGVRARLV